MAERVGLQICLEKTEYMSNQKDAPENIATKYGNIKRGPKFKYLREMVHASGLEKDAHSQTGKLKDYQNIRDDCKHL